MSDSKARAVVLISGSGSNLQAIIDASQNPDYPVSIAAVISNIEGVKGLERAQAAGIANEVLSHKTFDSREAFDQQLSNLIDSYSPDLVILAGFMRILSENFVHHYQGRMLNIHPSLLPKYRGLHTHRRAIEAGDKTHGATVHFVTAELDGGPLVLQASVAINDDDTEDTLAARVLQKEHIIYPKAVKWFGAKRLILQDGKVLFDGKIQDQPLQLS